MNEEAQVKIPNTILSWSKTIGFIVTIIGLTITCVLWASTEHSSLKSFTLEQDYVIKKDIESDIKDRYVPKENFSRIEEGLKGQKEDINEIKEKLDQIFQAVHNK